MTFLPIFLGVRHRSDAEETAPRGRSFSKEQIEKVLWRDAFTCQCCGFASKKYQRVIPSEGDGKSLVTVCTFCEMCFALDRAGLTGAGTLVWLPEIPQADLNHITRALYVALAAKDELSKAASRALETLKGRRIDAKKRLGTDDPLLLATALQEELDGKQYAARAQKLEGIRLLPADKCLVRKGQTEMNIFPQMLSFWTSSEGPFGQKPVAEWAALFEKISTQVQA